MTKLAVPVDEAAVMAGVGRTRLYAAISARELTAKKYGRRTIIAVDDLERWIKGLPAFSPKEPRQAAA